MNASPARERLLVLSPGQIPTTDYYFATRAAAMPAGSVELLDTRVVRPRPARLESADCVVVVRHAPLDWLRALRRWGGRVVQFLDDDLRSAWRASELPRRYALRTSARHALLRWQLGNCASWVSTPELARRYAAAGAAHPRVLAPLYIEGCGSSAREASVPGYFYHGTWAHRREIEWLVPVVREVQRRVPKARFEVLGDARVERMYRGIPGVAVCRAMSWPDYLARPVDPGMWLGLAPCLDSPFNRARSHVKLLDITRLGAAGIYSRRAPYESRIGHGVTGWLCDDHPEVWIEAICRALADPQGCLAVHARALADCRAERDAAGGIT